MFENVVAAAPPAPPPPVSWAPVPAVGGSRTVELDWNASTEPDVAYYAVRRSRQPDPDTPDWIRLAPDFTSSEATDSNLAPGIYYYYVTSVSTAGVVSARSDVIEVEVEATAPVFPATGLVVGASGSEVSLDWDDNAGTQFSYFAV